MLNIFSGCISTVFILNIGIASHLTILNLNLNRSILLPADVSKKLLDEWQIV